MPSGTFWSRWAKPTLETIQAIGVFLAGIGLIIAAGQLTLASRSESATLGLQFDDRMSQPAMAGISDAVESTPQLPILQAKHGTFTEDQLDTYLGDYDTLYYLHEQGLIDDKMLDDLFCGDVEDAYKDPEITNYLRTDRAVPGNTADWIGFDKLATYCNKLDNSPEEKILEE